MPPTRRAKNAEDQCRDKYSQGVIDGYSQGVLDGYSQGVLDGYLQGYSKGESAEGQYHDEYRTMRIGAVPILITILIIQVPMARRGTQGYSDGYSEGCSEGWMLRALYL